MKERQKLIFLIGLVVVAAIVWTFVWNKQSGDSQQVFALGSYKLLAVENPQIHWNELKRAEETEYKTNGRNPFSTIKPPTAQEKATQAAAVAAQAPKVFYGPLPPPPVPLPPPPTLPVKYFGYGTVPNGSPRRAFFTDGDDVYIVPEGEVLLGRFRILKIGNTNVEFQEISSGRDGTAPLEEAAAPASGPSALQ
jgi:hypothetical protein